LIAIVFAALGTTIGSVLVDMQGFQLVMNFLVLPIFFLSGALFPLNDLPMALGVITKLDPLSYGIDGLRGALIGISHFGLAIDVAVLCTFAVGLTLLGSRFFSKIQL
jgi:ABC-2 type transport system permease protein